jgi:uncharacterized protein (UPF0333 family)
MATIRVKKGQAALEFLTTYAWAFVVILIVIGALSYFGITNPSRLLPDRCTPDAEFACDNFLINTQKNTVLLTLRYSGSNVINATDFTLRTENNQAFCYSNNSMHSESGVIWPSGSTINIILNSTVPGQTGSPCPFISNGIVQGEKTKLFITFNYYELKSGVTYQRPSQVELYSKPI